MLVILLLKLICKYLHPLIAMENALDVYELIKGLTEFTFKNRQKRHIVSGRHKDMLSVHYQMSFI